VSDVLLRAGTLVDKLREAERAVVRGDDRETAGYGAIQRARKSGKHSARRLFEF
jgi:sirohydrochlorin ferrochelatase